MKQKISKIVEEPSITFSRKYPSPKDQSNENEITGEINQEEKEASKVKQYKLSRLIYPSLSIYEISFLTAAWIIFLGYEWYLVYLVSKTYYRKFLRDGYLEDGMFSKIIPYQADTSDYEWAVFSRNMMYTIPWILFHFVGSQILRKINQDSVPVFNVLLSAIHMGRVMGPMPTMWIFLQPLTMFITHLIGSSTLVWLMAGVFLFPDKEWTGPFYHINKFLLKDSTHTEGYIIYVTWYWVISRCISYCLDRIWKEVKPSEKGKLHDLIEMFAYCFYLPINMSGPIIIHKEFHEGFHQEYQPWSLKRFGKFLLQVLRYSFWFAICHLVIHFFYQSSISHQMEILKSLGFWTLAGVGFSVGGFFNLKYIVFYGFPRPFIVEDGITKAPPHPKCIYRIHRYSEMWRFFDNGLYLFLRKYIYQPIAGEQGGALRKIVGATVTFGFVYVWHGVSNQVMIWSMLNYLSVMTEMVATSLGKCPQYVNIEKRFLGPRGRRRLHALLGAPLLIGSVLANFYFFMGSKVGHYFVYRACDSWSFEMPLVTVLAYIGSQFSIEVKNWELEREIKREKLKYD